MARNSGFNRQPVDRAAHEGRKKRRSSAQVYMEEIGHNPRSHPQELLDAAHDYYSLHVGQDPQTARKSAAKFVTGYAARYSGFSTEKYVTRWNSNSD